MSKPPYEVTQPQLKIGTLQNEFNLDLYKLQLKTQYKDLSKPSKGGKKGKI